MLCPEDVISEAWSTALVRGGIALMIAAALLGAVSLILLYRRKRQLNILLEEEFGKKRY